MLKQIIILANVAELWRQFKCLARQLGVITATTVG